MDRAPIIVHPIHWIPGPCLVLTILLLKNQINVMWMLLDIAKPRGSKNTSKCISRKIVSQNILSSPALAAEVSDTDDEVFVDDW